MKELLWVVSQALLLEEKYFLPLFQQATAPHWSNKDPQLMYASCRSALWLSLAHLGFQNLVDCRRAICRRKTALLALAHLLSNSASLIVARSRGLLAHPS